MDYTGLINITIPELEVTKYLMDFANEIERMGTIPEPPKTRYMTFTPILDNLQEWAYGVQAWIRECCARKDIEYIIKISSEEMDNFYGHNADDIREYVTNVYRKSVIFNQSCVNIDKYIDGKFSNYPGLNILYMMTFILSKGFGAIFDYSDYVEKTLAIRELGWSRFKINDPYELAMFLKNDSDMNTFRSKLNSSLFKGLPHINESFDEILIHVMVSHLFHNYKNTEQWGDYLLY